MQRKQITGALLGWMLILVAGNAYSIDILSSYQRFLDRDNNPYLEFQYKIPSEGLTYIKQADGSWQAFVEMRIKVLFNDSLLFKDLYELQSPQFADSTMRFDLTDLKHLPLKKGKYRIFLSATDLSNYNNVVDSTVFSIKAIPELLSDISFVDNLYELEQDHPLAKNKIIITPKIDNLINIRSDSFLVYLEQYDATSKNISFEITPLFSEQKLSISNKAVQGSGFIRLPSPAYPGQFVLKASCENELRLAYFEVVDDGSYLPFTKLEANSLDTLVDYFRPITTIKEAEEFSALLAADSSEKLRHAIFLFWERRNPANPAAAFNQYLSVVNFVNQEFAIGELKGYRSDRGRVFLQYGKPADIVTFHDNPQTYPYEIWQYADDGKNG